MLVAITNVNTRPCISWGTCTCSTLMKLLFPMEFMNPKMKTKKKWPWAAA